MIQRRVHLCSHSLKAKALSSKPPCYLRTGGSERKNNQFLKRKRGKEPKEAASLFTTYFKPPKCCLTGHSQPKKSLSLDGK